MKNHNISILTHRYISTLLFALFFSINLVVFGQNDDITYHQAPNTAKNEPKKKANTEYLERISIGGTGGLQIGNFTYIELSPNAAYHFNNMFCAGIGGTYIFYQEKFYSYTYTDHIYGPRAFAEGHFFNFLGLHAAYQGLNYKRALPTIEKPRIWSNNLCVGGGYYQRTGRFAMYVYLLWNFSDRSPEENIYKNPLLFKAGFDFFLR